MNENPNPNIPQPVQPQPAVQPTEQQPAPQPAQQPVQPQQPGQPQQPFTPQPQMPPSGSFDPTQNAPQNPQDVYTGPTYNGANYTGGTGYGYGYGAGQIPPQGYYPTTPKAPTPIGALICGIGSLVCLLFMPLIGIPLGIVGIVLASKHAKQYGKTDASKAAKICGIVGTVLSTLFTLLIILAFSAMFAFMDSSSYDMEYLLGDEMYEWEMEDEFFEEDFI